MDKQIINPDISVVICCFNSEKRLPETLAYLGKQSHEGEFSWELLIIDNASTDNTAEVAQQYWQSDSVQLKIIKEPVSGLSNARRRGISESSGKIICFLDDDNWVRPDYLSNVFRIFSENEDISGCGGPLEAVFEAEPPFWFEECKEYFSIWDPQIPAGIVNRPLYGAGLCLRRSVLLALYDSGFQSLLSDRKGKELSSGGDFELCYVLMKRGEKLFFDPSLRIRHFMPSSRLTWDTLRQLHLGFGRQSVIMDLYEQKKLDSWWLEYLHSLLLLGRFAFSYLHNKEGDREVLLFLNQWGRIKSLWELRFSFSMLVKKISG